MPRAPAIVLLTVWLGGCITANTLGGLIHLLLVVAFIVLVLQGSQRRPQAGWSRTGRARASTAGGGGRRPGALSESNQTQRRLPWEPFCSSS